MRALDLFSRGILSMISFALLLLAIGLLAYAAMHVYQIFRDPNEDIAAALLGAIGYTVIALAVFEVAKYIIEEEVVHPSEMRYAGEARRGLTKFIATITIAVFLEALVLVFAAGKSDDMSQMLYPTLLLLSGVAVMVGLGIYQRLSAAAELAVGGTSGEAEAEKVAEQRREQGLDADGGASRH